MPASRREESFPAPVRFSVGVPHRHQCPPADSARDPPTTLPGETGRDRSSLAPSSWHRPETLRSDCSRSGRPSHCIGASPRRNDGLSSKSRFHRRSRRLPHPPAHGSPEPAPHPAPRPHPIEHGPVSAGIHRDGPHPVLPPTANNCVVPPHPATPGDTPPAIRASRTVSRNHPVPRPTRPRPLPNPSRLLPIHPATLHPSPTALSANNPDEVYCIIYNCST